VQAFDLPKVLLLTPSTIPIGGSDAGVAQGAAVPDAKVGGPVVAEGGNVLPAPTVCLDPMGWLMSFGFLNASFLVCEFECGSMAVGSLSHLKSEPKGKC
jgi:hypothetical protein